MRKKCNSLLKRIKSNEKGITILALVVTIIVLIILAEISIPMMTGNNGLILQAISAKRSADRSKFKEKMQVVVIREMAKSDTLNATTLKNELERELNTNVEIIGLPDTIIVNDNEVFFIADDGTILDANEEERNIELRTREMKNDLEAINSEYIASHGFLSGIGLEKPMSEMVLPEGYEIYDVNGENKIENSTNLGTGMVIKKNGNNMGRVLVYGDILGYFDGNPNPDFLVGDGEIDAGDLLLLLQATASDSTWDLSLESYQTIASDVNHDGVINREDPLMIIRIIAEWPIRIEQNVPARRTDTIKIESYNWSDEDEEYNELNINIESNEFAQ